MSNNEESNRNEIEHWNKIQNERECDKCICFDPSRKGKNWFCTYAFALNLKLDADGKQVCVRPMTKSEGPIQIE